MWQLFRRGVVLVIYSQADELTDAQFVEECIVRWRKRDVTVQSLPLTDSAHVTHFRAYPTEYGNAVRDFLAATQ